MITLTLLHPLQDTAVQNWTFEKEPVIRIGRSTDNNVILYSAVVSRHHVELRREADCQWELRNIGTNGTYLDGKRISQVSVVDGTVIRLARSGPKIKISISAKTGAKPQRWPQKWPQLQNGNLTAEPVMTQTKGAMRREGKKAPPGTSDSLTWVPFDDEESQPSTKPDLNQQD
ncbi:MAG: FHA domain-containing protein [Hormoscilla sp.]